MKSMLLRVILFFMLTSCVFQSDKRTTCNCCDTPYKSIDSALNCISRNSDNKTTIDNRLFLFAFITKDDENNQNGGWGIIKDQDIIDVAKRNYLLIILDPNDLAFQKEQQTDELKEIIRDHKENLIFVITNQALYPFADWTEKERKDIIIDRIEVGIGP